VLEWVLGAAALGFSLRYTWWLPPVGGVGVLMYHMITDELRGTRLPKLRVSPRRFMSQLRWLKRRGYTTLTLSEALTAPSLPPRSVVITFDDGYLDFFTTAWPILRIMGMTATVFVVAGCVGRTNEWDEPKGEPAEPLMDESQLRQLADEGIEIASHTLTHPDLTTLDDAGVRRELTESKALLEEITGREIKCVSYPYGNADRRVISAARAAGYHGGCITRHGKLGPATDPLAIPRIIIKRSDDMLDFSLKISRARSRL